MKAARIHSFGRSAKVRIEDVPIPRVRRGMALVRVRAAGVNPVDWMERDKIYNPRGTDRLPLTLGQDVAGVIEDIAPGTRTSFRRGDEVFGAAWGAFAQFVAARVKDLVRKPRRTTFVEAAAIPLTALTAYQSMALPESAGGLTLAQAINAT